MYYKALPKNEDEIIYNHRGIRKKKKVRDI